jgi:2-deoxy-D-gluconate 3-dehydrogenase
MAEEAERLAGGIDILVNNAGTIRRHPALEFPLDDWEHVLRTNLDAVFLLARHFGRRMVERGAGKIINIASLLSFSGGITVPAYTASKHAVAGLTKALANEWAASGVQVNAIAPGYFRTDNTQALQDDETRSTAISARIPAGRWGDPADVIGPVVFLASGASDYVNGHVLTVDGGWMAR